MTLMIRTTELAQALYLAWRNYEEIHGHQLSRIRSYGANVEMIERTGDWSHLAPLEQDQWRQVAMAAGQKLTGAFGDTASQEDPCESRTSTRDTGHSEIEREQAEIRALKEALADARRDQSGMH